MADDKRENRPGHDARMTEEMRHKTRGHGTHGAPTGKEIDHSAGGQRDLPEGNGATGQPAAFPDKEP